MPWKTPSEGARTAYLWFVNVRVTHDQTVQSANTHPWVAWTYTIFDSNIAIGRIPVPPRAVIPQAERVKMGWPS